MPVMDEFQEERAALKQAGAKAKWQYFLDYYKWHAIIAIAAVFFIVSLVCQIVNRKDYALYVAMLNTREKESAGEYISRYAEYAGIDMAKQEIFIDTSLYIDLSDPAALDRNTLASSEKLLIRVAAGEVDAIVSDEAPLISYAYNGAFYDLREILTQEQIARYESCFFYIDQADADGQDKRPAAGDTDSRPAGRSPETMEHPVPVGIYLDAAEGLREHYTFLHQDMVLSIVRSSKNLEAASAYISFVLP